MNPLEIRIAQTGGELAEISCDGFLPIRPEDVYVDAPSWEPFALEAYRRHHGARRDDPRFVVVGRPTEDATLAIAALASLIPYGLAARSGEVASLVSRLASGEEIDLLEQGDAGAIILAWRRRQERRREAMWEEAVTDWAQLIAGHDGMADVPMELEATREAEMKRRAIAS